MALPVVGERGNSPGFSPSIPHAENRDEPAQNALRGWTTSQDLRQGFTLGAMSKIVWAGLTNAARWPRAPVDHTLPRLTNAIAVTLMLISVNPMIPGRIRWCSAIIGSDHARMVASRKKIVHAWYG